MKAYKSNITKLTNKHMTTIINTPRNSDDSNSALSTIIGIIVLLVAVVLFIIYALPSMQNSKPNTEEPKANTAEVNVTIPVDETLQP